MSKKKHKPCPCGDKNVSQSCRNCSQYKIVFLLKNEAKHLKLTHASGKRVNPIRWSFIKEEKKTFKELFTAMLNRAMKNDPELYNNSNYIYLYHRGGVKPLDVFRP